MRARRDGVREASVRLTGLAEWSVAPVMRFSLELLESPFA